MSLVIDPIASHARFRPRALSLVDLETAREWTYHELDRDADRLAAWLTARLGPASGSRVAALARNCAELVLLQIASARAGAIFVPLNWRLAASELAALIDDASPALLFASREFNVPGRTVERFDIAGLATLADPASQPSPSVRRDFGAPITLLYTSGTSGRPKGVIVTDANAFWGALNFSMGNQVTPDSVFLCDMPLFHTAGLFGAAGSTLLAGGTLLVSAGFDSELTAARLADPGLGVTHYFCVPQMAAALAATAGFAPASLARLKMLAMGGAPNPPAQIERFLRAGVPMSDGFGMSETGSNFGMPVADPALLLAKAGSSGLPFLSVRWRIVGETGEDLPPGQAGELWLGGPSVSPGYWNQPELTATAFADGWFRSGDIARRDEDGFLHIVDRRKDMYISGGENVYPAEIEAILAELPEIAEAAVIGVADTRWGEVGRAFVVPASGSTLDEVAVLAHCRARLARFKAPAAVRFVSAIPRTASGKVQKHLLARD
jgi:fatty-acyl-CoA synthase